MEVIERMGPDFTGMPEQNTAEDVRRELDAVFGAPAAQTAQSDNAPPDGTLTELPLALLEPYPKEKHRFRPYAPEQMEALVEDVRRHGVLQPLLVRPVPGGRYQIVSGHNRTEAARRLGYRTAPCIVRRLDDEEAQLQMISSNLRQREKLYPSEKAWAYRDELEILNRRGWRSDLAVGQDFRTFGRICPRLRSDEIVAEDGQVSRRTIQNYVRLTRLIPTLLERVDQGKLAVSVGVTLSYLSEDGQEAVERFFFSSRSAPLTQAAADRLRELEEDGALTEERLAEQFLSPAVRPVEKVSVRLKKWSDRFEGASRREIERIVDEALREYFERRR